MPTNHSKFSRAGIGFTLVELLVVISVIALLMSVLLPVLGRARSQAKTVICLSNLKQLGFAFVCYALDYDDYAMPNYEPSTDTYWWGQKLATGIDHEKGFVWPYLKSTLKKNSVFECPAQRYGSYGLQAKPPGELDEPKWITSTYGYNGYYLSPPKSPWPQIRHRPWQKVMKIRGADQVIAFADTLIDWDYTGRNPQLQNNAMVDPPYILAPSGSYWQKNLCPTTCFRHNDRANIVFVDVHCEPMKLNGGKYTSPKAKIGSISEHNAPYYVPDYKSWVTERRRGG